MTTVERTPTQARNLAIAEAYATGEVTMEELAQANGISRERVRQIIARIDPGLPRRVIEQRQVEREERAEAEARREARAAGAHCVLCGKLVTRRFDYPGNDRGGFALTCSPECAQDYVVVRDLVDEDRARKRRDYQANTILRNPSAHDETSVTWAKRWKAGKAAMRRHDFQPGSDRERVAEKWGLA